MHRQRRMNRATRIAALAIVTLAVGGCTTTRLAEKQNSEFEQRYESVGPGMAESEIRAVMGRPYSRVPGCDIYCAGEEWCGALEVPTAAVETLRFVRRGTGYGMCAVMHKSDRALFVSRYIYISDGQSPNHSLNRTRPVRLGSLRSANLVGRAG
jgi:hypothetical protein